MNLEQTYADKLQKFGNIFGELVELETERSHVDVAEARGILLQTLMEIMVQQHRAQVEAEEEDCVILTPHQPVDNTDSDAIKH